MKQLTLKPELVRALRESSQAKGLTHTFYGYPARFSPNFPREVISQFTSHGDTILDPFMGSGTTMVEALVAGRDAIGVDINPLASFLTRVKTTSLDSVERALVFDFVVKDMLTIRINSKVDYDPEWNSGLYQKNLPWNLKKFIHIAVQKSEELNEPSLVDAAKCILLRTAKWALDNKKTMPTVKEFRQKLFDNAHVILEGYKELDEKVSNLSDKPKLSIHQMDSRNIDSNIIGDKPSLVITSPPYPGVHVLYHRWQVKGRKETAAPYWIIGSQDGHGEAFYTLGGRSRQGKQRYFEYIQNVFRNVHGIVRDGALVFQLLGFSHIEKQLPMYLEAMRSAGYQEVYPTADSLDSNRLWRQVPNRKWYASYKGLIPASKEVLLIHEKI